MAVGIVMLTSGFSMLFIETYVGFGAVVLSMGVMSMMLSLMVRVLVNQIRKWMDYNARIEETVANILSLKQAYSLKPPIPEKERKALEEQVTATAT